MENRSLFALALGLAALGAAAGAGRASSAVPLPRHAAGRLLVGFQRSVPEAQVDNVFTRFGLRRDHRLKDLPVYVTQAPAGLNLEATRRALLRRQGVVFAELDMGLRPSGIPNDPLFTDAWHLARIAAPTAWNLTTGSASEIIAILDTGVDAGQPDLQGKLVDGRNFLLGNTDTTDTYGHGTPVAGVAAAATNNGLGVSGVSWGARIMPCKVTDSQGYGYVSAMADALIWAADHGARVANISFEVTTSATVTSAAQYFESKGGVVVIAAGNESFFDSTADNPDVITVSATDADDALTPWTNSGNNVDLSAPGDWIYTTDPGSTYSPYSGTSFAAPVVAGVAALMLSVNPALTAADLQSLLAESADDLGPAGWDPGYGAGRVNAYRAVSLAAGSDLTPPSVSFTAPAENDVVSGSVAVQVAASDVVGIASVEVWVDSTFLGRIDAAPYNFTWNTSATPEGAHTLLAFATDGAGNVSTATQQVTVTHPDLQPPAVSFVAPAAGSTVSGTVSVEVSATDDVGVTSVSLQVVGGALVGTLTTAPYTFAWNSVAILDGAYTLRATARDVAGHVTIVDRNVTVRNPDIRAPTVRITTPASGDRVSGNVSVRVQASDDRAVVRVELYVDGVLKATSSVSPFTNSWSAGGASRGAHSLQCKAYDAAGNVGTSAAISVTR